MMYYSRFKMLLVGLVCLIGVLLCIPNLVAKPSPALPWRQIHLGLDLKGGSYLLMQVDLKSLANDRLQTLNDSIRQSLLNEKLGYRDISVDTTHHSLKFLPREASESTAVHKVLEELPQAVPHEFSITTDKAGYFIVSLSEIAMQERAKEAISQSIEIVRKRIDATGAVDPEITRQGDDRIVVQLPGITDPERVKKLLGTTAKMTFHLLDEQAISAVVAPPGVTMMPMVESPEQKLPVYTHVDVDGANLTNASAAVDQQTGEWAVNFTFDRVGAQKFGEITKNHIGHRFAIVLDNKVISAPVIRSAITEGNGQITGGFDAQKATDLALMLRAGALPAPLKVIEQRSIGPSLGADSIRAGALSLAVGFVLVIIFMALFYGLFGWYANIALLANLILMMAILSLFEATLTLPGMAGILLTLGMAVDANILINERVREEVNRGRTPLASLQAGFEHATATIIDSNATALLAHVMLFVFGTGPVRGFALTITIGIVTTLFTTLLLSRMLMVRWYAITHPKELPV
ncbi:protein translocase subunit SecD [Entomobacter blattae]|uniref:Protein translocase subunit SecD n=1 Tax=Entomobacter blattae TaxID=2762277 RepID=A0A7H1NS21_9PROT|nr:protein translocase subunit SecD [Entomobacter blattae]QNT78581.1 Protein translocase subunit SecD [Entomobacter blattae]